MCIICCLGNSERTKAEDMGQEAVPGRVLLSYTSEFRNRFGLTTSAEKREAAQFHSWLFLTHSVFILINCTCHFGDAFSLLFLSIHALCLLGMNFLLAITKETVIASTVVWVSSLLVVRHLF